MHLQARCTLVKLSCTSKSAWIFCCTASAFILSCHQCRMLLQKFRKKNKRQTEIHRFSFHFSPLFQPRLLSWMLLRLSVLALRWSGRVVLSHSCHFVISPVLIFHLRIWHQSVGIILSIRIIFVVLEQHSSDQV